MLPATVTPAHPSEAEERHFPHLNERQEAFCVNYVALSGNAKRAAIAAGYGKAGAHVQGHRLLQNPAICQAILELSAMRQASMVPVAMGVVSTLMQSSKSDYVRLEAAKDALTRAGLNAPKKVQVSGGVSINIDVD